MKVASIVEGHGEVVAVPELLRRLGLEREDPIFIDARPPVRIPRDKLLKEGELERAIELAMLDLNGSRGGVLILIDAEDDCPAALGPKLLHRARTARPDLPIRVVLANREFEAWFLAAAASLAGKRHLPPDLQPPPDPEALRGAKEWLERRAAGRYRETIDQVKLTAVMSLEQAALAPSFRKLRRDFESLVREIETGAEAGGG